VKLIKSFLLIIGATAGIFVVILAGLLEIAPTIHTFVNYWAERYPLPIIIGGLAVAVGSLVVLNFVGRESDTTGTFTFEGKKGQVEISLRAIEDYITKHFSNKPVVHSLRTRVGTSRDRKKIRVRASISVWSEQSLKTASETVQKEIEQCLNEGLGLDNVENVHVSVDKIIASKTSKPATRFLSARSSADIPNKDEGFQEETREETQEDTQPSA
jgi:uncharacterized alkaline shock family protein YloU